MTIHCRDRRLRVYIRRLQPRILQPMSCHHLSKLRHRSGHQIPVAEPLGIHALSDETHLMDCIEAADVVPSGEQGIGLRLLISLYRTDPPSLSAADTRRPTLQLEPVFGGFVIREHADQLDKAQGRRRHGNKPSKQPHCGNIPLWARQGSRTAIPQQYHSEAQRNGEISSVEDTTVRTWCGWSAGPPT